ncbi:MAG: DnaJ-like cysteine-rich domain-containing protein, partial [Planktothrix sp.]
MTSITFLTLPELKAKAAELGLSHDSVKEFGSLAKKATWEVAINTKLVELHVTALTTEPDTALITEPDTALITEPDTALITEPDTALITEPDLSFSRVLLEGLGVNLSGYKNDPPNPDDFTSLEDFQVKYDEYIQRIWKSDDDISQAESDFVDARDIWNQHLENLPNNSNSIPFDGDTDWVECPKCDGVGFIGILDDQICPHCFGEGLTPPNHTTSPIILGKSSRQIAVEIQQAFNGVHSVGDPCETCLGTGLVPDFNGDGDEICPDCNGTGYATDNDSIPFEDKLSNLAKPSPTPLRDELTERMRPYVGKTMTEKEWFDLQNEPLDEMTAAVFL